MKIATIKSGPFAGNKAEILGTDQEVLGQSYLTSPSRLAQEYFNRVFSSNLPFQGKVFYARIHGQPLLISERELHKKR